MKYILMCGGNYKDFKIPKHLSKIKGEVLVERTIRLLRENGVKKIYISTNNPVFNYLGDIPKLRHENNFTLENGKSTGYWLDAFYPTNEEVCYIFGDVYFSDKAIKTIVEYQCQENTLFGNSVAKNEFHENWGEPFAYKVVKPKEFRDGINKVKELYDQGKIIRHPIVWELYRYLNNLDINIQRITNNYVCIDDYTIDIDYPDRIDELNSN